MTKVQLRQKLINEPSFVNNLLAYNQNIRSTNNFWYARSRDLDIENELQQIYEDLEDESDIEIDPFIDTNEIQRQFIEMSRTGTNPHIINLALVIKIF